MFVAGCADTRTFRQSKWRELLLSTPGHYDDWRALRRALTAAGVRCSEGPSSLGTLSLLIQSNDFTRAKDEALRLIARDSLTVRVRSGTNSWVYEVWQNGQWVREETYVVDKRR
jgi:hypothetical protein